MARGVTGTSDDAGGELNHKEMRQLADRLVILEQRIERRLALLELQSLELAQYGEIRTFELAELTIQHRDRPS